MWWTFTICNLNINGKIIFAIFNYLCYDGGAAKCGSTFCIYGGFPMIQNLNPISFQSFGTILHSRLSKNDDSCKAGSNSAAERTSLTLPHAQIPIRRSVENVYLYPDPGLCVLSVSHDGETYAHFYLDKTVHLQDGINFFLSPFHGKTALQLSGSCQIVGVLPEAPDHRVHPQLVIPRLYTFFYQEREQGFVFPGESHHMYELTYIDQGSMHSVADGVDMLLETGDMVVYGPHQWHMHYADIGVAPRYVTVSFDAEGRDLSCLMNCKFKSPQKAITLFQQMLREQDRMDDYSEDMILNLLQQLILTLLRQANAPSQPVKSPQCINNENEIIRKAQQYISENVRSKLSVPLVAKNTDVSASYLTSLFHKHLQISPGEYIRRVKLQESKQMIREGNMNFSQIAQTLQYSTIHHFSRQFKEKFGITPTEYAKSVK